MEGIEIVDSKIDPNAILFGQNTIHNQFTGGILNYIAPTASLMFHRDPVVDLDRFIDYLAGVLVHLLRLAVLRRKAATVQGHHGSAGCTAAGRGAHQGRERLNDAAASGRGGSR
jgi:hypothetical protein